MADTHDAYPDAREVDGWCQEVLRRAEGARLKATILDDEVYDSRLGVRHTKGAYVRFKSVSLGSFYGFWQPCPSGRGPLLVHLPGYSADVSAHPELVADGYNVLHASPLGYATPRGPDESKRVNGNWPVMGDTIKSCGERGYVDWLAQAAAAALWGLRQKCVERGRFAVFGTSQGGGTALMLASILRERGVRAVAADEPFLVNYPVSIRAKASSAYALVSGALAEVETEHPEDLGAAWRALGFADAICHAHRLAMPVLLTAGTADVTCPPAGIRPLFERLPGTRAYVEMAGQAHGYTTPFLHLARAWFRLYV